MLEVDLLIGVIVLVDTFLNQLFWYYYFIILSLLGGGYLK